MRKEPKSPRRDHLTRTTGEGRIELTEQELSHATGGRRDGSLEAGIHFKYDLKAQKEA